MLSLIVGSCGTVRPPHTPDDGTAEAHISKAEKLAAQGSFSKAADLYWQAAQNAEPPVREEYQLRAAELQIEAGNFPLAYQYLGLINEQNLTFELIPRKRISEANIALQEERYSDALSYLPQNLVTRAPEHQVDILQLRAIALAGSGNTFASIV